MVRYVNDIFVFRVRDFICGGVERGKEGYFRDREIGISILG